MVLFNVQTKSKCTVLLVVYYPSMQLFNKNEEKDRQSMFKLNKYFFKGSMKS